MALNLLLSPLISFVVEKAGDSLIDQFCQIHGMKKNSKKLHRQLLAVQAVIADAESRGAKEPHVEAWLKELNAAACEAADVLDEFQYEALRQEAMRQKPSSSIKKATKSIISRENPILFRYKMSKKLTNVLEKINEIIIEMDKFGFITRDPQPDITRSPTHSFVNESEVIGRDNEKTNIMNMILHPKKNIVNMILDPNLEMESVSVLPIFGMGGVGKTALTQLVYNEEKVKVHFDLRMWVCVSNDFDVENIVKSMIEVVTSEKCELNNMEVYQNNIRKILEGKRYLLVLDDVWNEKVSKWDALKTLLFSGVSSGSVIIVTTRSSKVASIMGTIPGQNLGMLSYNDSWELFRKRAFGEIVEPKLVNIGYKIVSRCAGLPLALKAIGALMRDKRDVRDWIAISESTIWDEASTNEILPALKLSYDHLPSYMKQCFAFCAIFPQDYVIEKETLIQLWMANDFIPTNEISDPEDKGREIFSELFRRSFFEDMMEENDGYLTITRCKMHDLMHDLAKHIVGKQCATMLEVDSDPIRYLSIFDDQTLYDLNSVFKQCPTVRTCLISKGFLEESKHGTKSIPLRALQVNINRLPKEMRFMKHLRYLDLSYGEFDSLPETISALYNLQTLKLSNSNISKLPDDMRYMNRLRHLFIDGCRNLKRMPIGLGQLRCLRTLTNYMVECHPGCTITELNNLDLHGSLILSGLENVRDRNEANEANMVSKTNLSFLTLEWGSQVNNDTTRNDQEVLYGLGPSTELRELEIAGYAGFDIPIWMKNTFTLRNLRKLFFVDCYNCTTLPSFWCLPLLEELELIRMRSLMYVCSSPSFEDKESENLIMFPRLKELHIYYLDSLERWHERDDKMVAFPQLERLELTGVKSMVYFCSSQSTQVEECESLIMFPNLKELIISELDKLEGWHEKDDKLVAFPQLERLELMGMKSLVYICSSHITKVEVEDNESLTMFPNLEILKITDLNNLEGWHEKNDKLLAFPQLKELTIESCPKLKAIPCAPMLEDLRISKSKGIKLLQISNLTMAANSAVYIYWDYSREHDAFKPPKNVDSIHVTGFENVIPLGEEEDEDEELTLRYLTMERCNWLFSCGPSKLELGFWKHFAFLETLSIIECSALSLWPEQEFRSLNCLKRIHFSRCKNFTCLSEVSSSSINSYAEDILPQLESLTIASCWKLVKIPSCSKSLRALYLRDCPSVSKEGLNWLKNLHELEEIRVIDCDGLKSLPDGMKDLISLKYLTIVNCPEIESFPEGLQQWLSALQYLKIEKCPLLEKRCRSGGDYHHMISVIPALSLPSEELLLLSSY